MKGGRAAGMNHSTARTKHQNNEVKSTGTRHWRIVLLRDWRRTDSSLWKEIRPCFSPASSWLLDSTHSDCAIVCCFHLDVRQKNQSGGIVFNFLELRRGSVFANTDLTIFFSQKMPMLRYAEEFLGSKGLFVFTVMDCESGSSALYSLYRGSLSRQRYAERMSHCSYT